VNSNSLISVDDHLPPSGVLVIAIDENDIPVQAMVSNNMWYFPHGGTGYPIEYWKEL